MMALVSKFFFFLFQRPEIASAYPRIGPIAGGTVITFQGHDLDVGGIFNVLLDYIPCVTDRSALL